MNKPRKRIPLAILAAAMTAAISQANEPPEAPILIGIDAHFVESEEFRDRVDECSKGPYVMECLARVVADWKEPREPIPLQTVNGITWLPADLYAPFLAEMRACSGIEDPTSEQGCFKAVVDNYAALSRGRQNHDD